ncbi:MAG: hypothetical protein GC161_18515 [Planctomycetaceae bacterium]|nr:hypothetical protein [Planctomycetaceae bacterium]
MAESAEDAARAEGFAIGTLVGFGAGIILCLVINPSGWFSGSDDVEEPNSILSGLPPPTTRPRPAETSVAPQFAWVEREAEERARVAELEEAEIRAKAEDLKRRINAASEDERRALLEELLNLDPNTAEFEEELTALREQRAARETAAAKFVEEGLDQPIPAELWELLGQPEELGPETGRYSAWVLREARISFVEDRLRKKVAFVARDPESAATWLESFQRERKRVVEAGFHPWDGSHVALEKWIHEQIEDPDSYRHDETTYVDRDDHVSVMTKFRASNRFGALIRGWVLAEANLDGSIRKILATSESLR